jgi:dihydroorotate dehydrogenase (fumarate)
MDFRTTYLGLPLSNPIIPGASPLSDALDSVRRLEDAGAPAIVLRSLFEEQIVREQMAEHSHLDAHAESFAEAVSYFPGPDAFVLGTDQYLEHLHRVKATVHVPVIASLNGTTAGGWLEYARLMEQAGADAIELNVYRVATRLDITGAEIERQTIDVVQAVKHAVRIPIAVKLSPSYTALGHMAAQIDGAGANGLVLFNRFYQPDLDIEELAVSPTLHLSSSAELLPRLHWTAILSGRIQCSLAVTGGVHTAEDIIKATMAGAHATQVVSALLMNGPQYLRTLIANLMAWMEKHEWESLSVMRGNLSFLRVPDPEAYERANYMLMLQSWKDVDMPFA